MNVLHLFSGFNIVSEVAYTRGFDVVSVDACRYQGHLDPSFICDVLDFDYKSYSKSHFDFIIIGFPCNCFSKVGRFRHFDRFWNPISLQAHKMFNLLTYVIDVLKYFDKAVFVLENPTSSIGSWLYFQKVFLEHCEQIVRVPQGCFGHITQKKTDLFTNSKNLILVPEMYRVNGKCLYPDISNFGYKKKTAFPVHFVNFLFDNFL